jgi:hypothetical protein
MTYLFRPVDRPERPTPPVGSKWRGLLAVVAHSLLARTVGLFSWAYSRGYVGVAVMLVGLVVQGALVLLAAYLIDLSVSLMELWAELAKKHLELTL